MNAPETPSQKADADVWAQRQRNNVRLGWAIGAFTVAVFLIAIWKYRPL